MFNTTVYFNNFNIASLPGIKVVDYNVSELGSRILNVSKIARANRSVLTSAEYQYKNVFVTGYAGGEDWRTQQDNFDRLKGSIQDVQGIIRVEQGSKWVEYTGTLNAIQKDKYGQNLKFVLEFRCADPIGRDAVTTELFAPQAITTATLTKSITVDGSFTAEPRFLITINSITGGTNKSITLLNAGTGKGIKITRDFIAGDIITIASDALEVTANTNDIDFGGQFPKFLPGPRTLQYIDDFTTRDVTISATYNRRYS